MTPAALRVAFEQGLRDDQCVFVPPQDGLVLLDEIDKLRAGEEKLRYLLIELVAQVRGECPSLLDEDSGGDARLSIAIDDAIDAARSKP